MTDAIKKFLDHMREYGCEPENEADIIADDTRRYYRLAGDKAGVKKGSYVLRVDDDGFAVGGCMSMRDSVWHGWHSKSKRSASAEEKAAWEAKRVAARQARLEAERVERERAAQVSADMWAAAVADTVSQHPYVQRKRMVGDGLRVWTDLDRFEDWLLVPVMSGGCVVGMQKIGADGEKLFVPGSAVAGGHYWLGEPDGSAVVAICEGVATGDSVRQATGWPVCVAFNAGNLRAVSEVVRKGWPDAQVVILSDEDLWTWEHKHRSKRPEVLPDRDAPEWAEWRANGWLKNVGRVDAEQAAAAIGGAQVLGVAEGGDWNDLHVSAGLDEVRARLIKPVEIAQEWEPPVWDDEPVGLAYEDLDPWSVIRPLGHDKGYYYFFPAETGQIRAFTAQQICYPPNLFSMKADREYWMGMYQSDAQLTTKAMAELAGVNLMKACHDKRVFSPDNLRGVGVWRDGDKVVLNTGTRLYVDGGVCSPQEFNGRSVYETGQEAYSYGSAAPLKNAEANKTREIAKRFSWRDPLMGDLLAGLVVLAPISGVLDWRPHGVLTGEAGSGKSTLGEQYIKPLIGDIGIYLNGGTTEAGLRKKIGLSARPVFMDEAESETKRAKENMEAIMFVARNASSGASTANANADSNIRSCFILAAINPRITQKPDKDRFASLELVRNTAPDADRQWKELELDLKRTFTREYSAALFARTIENIDVLLDNIKTFGLAVTRVRGSARAGDQYGALLAGAFSLTSTRRVNEEFAEQWIRKQDWSFSDAESAVSEHEKFLATVLGMRLRYDKDGMARESSVGALVQAANNRDAMNHIEAIDALKGIGIKIDAGMLVFANASPGLSKMLSDTIWTEWRRLLMQFDGSGNMGNKTVYFGNGIRGKVTCIPLWHVLDGIAGEEELSLTGDDGEDGDNWQN